MKIKQIILSYNNIYVLNFPTKFSDPFRRKKKENPNMYDLQGNYLKINIETNIREAKKKNKKSVVVV